MKENYSEINCTVEKKSNENTWGQVFALKWQGNYRKHKSEHEKNLMSL